MSAHERCEAAPRHIFIRSQSALHSHHHHHWFRYAIRTKEYCAPIDEVVPGIANERAMTGLQFLAQI
jgi:hypothetical protein